MARKIIRAGVIGCGAIAQNCHLPGYAKEKDCILAGVFDTSRARLEEVRRRFPVEKTYSRWETLLEKAELDVVSVCSPNAFHATHAIAALKQGIHVLCEKPLCLTMADAKRIQKAQEKSGAIFMVGFTNRFYTGNLKAKQAIERGDIGQPFMLRARFAHSGPYSGWAKSNWFYDRTKAGGGALFDMGIHAIDLAQFYFGRICSVSALAGALVKDIPVDDNAVMLFEFEGNRYGYVEVGWTSNQGFFGIEIYGSDGAIVVDYLNQARLVRGETKPDGTRKEKVKIIDRTPTTGGWDVEVAHFLKHVRCKRQPEESLQTGIDALAVALAAYQSSKQGRKIPIDEFRG